jgi:hypothetical protein
MADPVYSYKINIPNGVLWYYYIYRDGKLILKDSVCPTFVSGQSAARRKAKRLIKDMKKNKDVAQQKVV